MLEKINPTKTRAWKRLKVHYKKMESVHMRDLFAEDPDRFNKFHLTLDDILVDYSKNISSRVR